jgi:hypothetical protein
MWTIVIASDSRLLVTMGMAVGCTVFVAVTVAEGCNVADGAKVTVGMIVVETADWQATNIVKASSNPSP